MMLTNLSYNIKVPGKLFIAGEYAVLEPNHNAVVIAVNRYISTYIKPYANNVLVLPQFNMENITWEMCGETIEFNTSDSRLNFIKNSLLVVYRFLKEKSIELQPFHLLIESDLDDNLSGKKYGLGSSAAVVTAVIAAVLKMHLGILESGVLDTIFKLSAIAHARTQGSGSGADIAAAVYGGWLQYSAFSSNWLLNELEKDIKLCLIIEQPWPNLFIQKLKPPPQLQLAVGWTQEVATTGPMIKKVQKFKESNQEAYEQFLNESSTAVSLLVKSFESKDYIEAIKAIEQNRNALKKLSEGAGINIETKKLRILCSIAEAFGCGKTSGAGGGDCGIAFLKSNDERQELYKAWEKENITPLQLSVPEKGVSIEDLI
jgi:phosphomevalonate kinase